MPPAPAAPPPVVAVAASAGGVEALKRLVADLPPDLPAAVMVALHLPASGRSLLAQILERRSRLAVRVAEDGVALAPATVFVGPPDAHLLVRDGRLVLGRGPRENGHRPSHDAMLRSVALDAGPAAVGLVLTGLLDDGAAGLACVARYGGTCLVQHPDDAEFSSMPRAALSAVPSARCLPLAALAPELTLEVERTVSAPHDRGPARPVTPAQRALDVAEVGSAEHGTPLLPDGQPVGTPSRFACPDCHGVLSTVPDAEVLRFRCRTGHAWTSHSLEAQLGVQVEEALWVALRVLEEREDLDRRLAEQADDHGRSLSATHFRTRAGEAGRSAHAIRALLEEQVREQQELPPAAVTGT